MPTVECMGESFEVQAEISAWAFADFADAMGKAGDSDELDPRTITAMMSLIQDCIVPDDWERFKTVTRAKRASFQQLMQVTRDMAEARAERPTGRSSDSPDGPTSTEQKSGLSLEDRALEVSGLRPDLKLAVLRTRGVA